MPYDQEAVIAPASSPIPEPSPPKDAAAKREQYQGLGKMKGETQIMDGHSTSPGKSNKTEKKGKENEKEEFTESENEVGRNLGGGTICACIVLPLSLSLVTCSLKYFELQHTSALKPPGQGLCWAPSTVGHAARRSRARKGQRARKGKRKG